MKTLYPAMAAVLLAGVSTGSAAQDERQLETYNGPTERQPPAQMEQFNNLDQNGDGVLDPREAEDGGITDLSFANLDVNDDGHIDPEEYEARTFSPRGPSD